MTPLYNMINQGVAQAQQPAQMTQGMSFAPQFANPVQKFNFIMQAMRNPMAFVKNAFPDIPDQIAYNADMILSYLQQTRGITNQQLQQLYNQYGNMYTGR